MYSTKDFFISYGRRESLGFVARLHRALILEGYTGWFDKVNIPDGDQFDQSIRNGVESADNFVFVMAPRCLTSPYCLVELEYARVLGKRVIPINQMVIFNTDDQGLSIGDQQLLKAFYRANGLEDQNITTTQQVLDRSLSLIGPTDWLDGKQKLSNEDCNELYKWAAAYENTWHKHEELDYLKQNKLPTFGEVTDTTESIIERIKLVAEKQKSYIQKHTQLTLEALNWDNHQRLNNFLLVGKERQAAEEWLLIEFTPPKQPPCQPSVLLCEFIGEARKNAENRMTDAFICSASQDSSIKMKVVRVLLRHAITSWSYETDIQKGTPYEKAIRQGIEGADNFFFLISPESVASKNCLAELEHALMYNKRLVPLLIAPTPEVDFPEPLRGLQYIDFTDNVDQMDFLSDIDDILNVINHDKSYYEEHKVLLVRALQWEASQRKSAFLLRGFNLENAQTWLRIHDERGLNPPTVLHREFLQVSEATKGQLNTDVFISYSRKDGDFARILNRKLQEAGKNTWFDQESISSGVDFEKEIFKGIAGADNIVFILSPDSVQSEYCESEVNYAAELGKRFITLLCRPTEPAHMPEVLRKVNWIDFTGADTGRPFTQLIQELELDRKYANRHTILQQRALEWEEHDRSPDFLLNNTATETALLWLETAKGKVPSPTKTQLDHIKKSQEAIEESRQEERKHQRLIISIISIAAVISLGFGTFGLVKMYEAKRNLKAAKLYSKRADMARVKANERKREVERERDRADSARNTLERYFEAIYFYGDNFALAGKENEGFYFIDRNGQRHANLGYWDQAEPFNRYGFSRVKNIGENWMLLDTAGRSLNIDFELDKLDKNTEVLDLNNQTLGYFPRKILQYPNLKILILDGNDIKRFPEDIYKIKSLEKLYIRENEIRRIPVSIGKLSKLKVLDLALNKIEKVPSQLTTLPALEYLNLFYNKVDEVRISSDKVSPLKTLDLRKSNLSKVDAIDLQDALPNCHVITY